MHSGRSGRFLKNTFKKSGFSKNVFFKRIGFLSKKYFYEVTGFLLWKCFYVRNKVFIWNPFKRKIHFFAKCRFWTQGKGECMAKEKTNEKN